MKQYDYIIFGAGIYGLYLAYSLSIQKSTKKILILEYDSEVFSRASFINQARVHNGYHYPRSLSTAQHSASYYDKFNHEFSFAINNKFDKIYSIANKFSYSNSQSFEHFCHNAKIPLEEVNSSKYFKKHMVEKSYLTQETSFDAKIIAKFLLSEIKKNSNCDILYNAQLTQVEQLSNKYVLTINNDLKFSSNFIINATYASTNQVLHHFNYEKFNIKYELTELILCNVSDSIQNAGITLMDGAFFSLMPFGLTGLYSLSSVGFTPHKTSYQQLPTFSCQNHHSKCTMLTLENCNTCQFKPKTNFIFMQKLAYKYLIDEINIQYNKSLFAVKAILNNSEISDSRPTLIKIFNTNPTFISVMSGKINTMYDLTNMVTQW
jgi:hypothetical protein